MFTVRLGADGALKIDEKFHTTFLKRAEKDAAYSFDSPCFAISDDKGRVARLDSDFTVKKCKRTFLGAVYKLASDSVPVKITATAITPHKFGEQLRIPAALLSFKIKNTSKKKRAFCFGAMVENCSEDSLHERIQKNTWGGVLLGPASKLSVHSGYLTQCIAIEGNANAVCYIDKTDAYARFCEMLRSGTAESSGCLLPSGKAYAAAMIQLEIPAGESVVLNTVYAWYAPNLEYTTEKGENLRFKCSYAACFDSSKAVAEYALKNAKHILLQSGCISSVIENSLDRIVSAEEYFEALEDIYFSVPFRFDEYGNGKMFYKNPFGTRFIYAKTEDCPVNALAYFNAEAAWELLNWQLEGYARTDGIVADLPRLCDNVLFFGIKDEVGFERQFSLIFRACRLISFGYGEISASAWNGLVAVWRKIQSMLAICDGSFLVHNADGVCDVFKTCMYILAAICMRKLAVCAGEREFADALESVAEKGQEFIKNRAFNGRFYAEFYPNSCDKTERCSLKQVIPFAIANALGTCLSAPKQLVVALENIYAFNYSEISAEQCGVKMYSDSDEIDASVELLYMLALMQCGKMNLASLIYKARILRGEKIELSYFIPILEAMHKSTYSYEDMRLRIGSSGAVLFRGSSAILIDLKKGFNVRVFGAPIQICSISGISGKVKRICFGDTEYMFTQKDDTVFLKSTIALSEEDMLIISLYK